MIIEDCNTCGFLDATNSYCLKYDKSLFKYEERVPTVYHFRTYECIIDEGVQKRREFYEREKR